jgi:hypothetical protein
VAGYRRIVKKQIHISGKTYKYSIWGRKRGILAVLLQTYLKNANLPNPSENIQLLP